MPDFTEAHETPMARGLACLVLAINRQAGGYPDEARSYCLAAHDAFAEAFGAVGVDFAAVLQAISAARAEAKGSAA